MSASEDVSRLIQDLKDSTDKIGLCCGCNTFAIDNAIQALEDYLNGAFECENTYHSTSLGDCCNNYIGENE